MNVLAPSTGGVWLCPGCANQRVDIYRMPLFFLEALARSGHRTADRAQADWFHVPVYDLVGAWGTLATFERARHYIASVWPDWNRSQDRHVWAVSRDLGSCTIWPYGSLRDVIGAGVLLTHWGGQTNLQGDRDAGCFHPLRDIVVPPVLRPSTVGKHSIA